jgi:hypothetical protein
VLLEHEAEVCGEQALELVGAGLGTARGFTHPVEELGLVAERDPDHEVFLALEVQVQRALAELGLGGDVIDGELARPLVGHHPLGGVEDAMSPLLTLALASFGDRHDHPTFNK